MSEAVPPPSNAPPAPPAKPTAAPPEKEPPPKPAEKPAPATAPTAAKPASERAGGSVPPASTPSKPAPKKKRSPVLAYAVIAVLVAGGGYVWWQVQSSGETTQTAAAPEGTSTEAGAETPAVAEGEAGAAQPDPGETATEDAASTAPSAPPSEAESPPVAETETAASPEPTEPAITEPSASESPPPAPPGIDEAELSAALASRDAEIAALRAETERLTAALKATTTRLAAVEKKAAERPPAIVSIGDPRAAGLVLAVGLLREAVRGSEAFAAELETLRALAAEDPEIAAALVPIEARAAQGIPTREQLRTRFPEVATAVVRAGALPDDPGWMERVTHQLATLVSVRRTGPDVPGDTAEARTARAEAAVNDGSLRGAVDSLAGLAGAAAAAAADWLGDAKARLDADDAMGRLQGLVVGRLSAGPATPAGAASADDSGSGG